VKFYNFETLRWQQHIIFLKITLIYILKGRSHHQYHQYWFFSSMFLWIMKSLSLQLAILRLTFSLPVSNDLLIIRNGQWVEQESHINIMCHKVFNHLIMKPIICYTVIYMYVLFMIVLSYAIFIVFVWICVIIMLC
jgi:hypothetical protein